jgi:hypothetical protein
MSAARPDPPDRVQIAVVRLSQRRARNDVFVRYRQFCVPKKRKSPWRRDNAGCLKGDIVGFSWRFELWLIFASSIWTGGSDARAVLWG